MKLEPQDRHADVLPFPPGEREASRPELVGEPTHYDVIIVGAGLSGIGAACLLQRRCPNKRFTLLEARESIGGTWDLFRYPGVRSDSDMQTLGYSFRPWRSEKSIADGPSILEYIKETAKVHGIDKRIAYRHKVLSAEWSSEGAEWRLEVAHGEHGERVHYTCTFLYLCSGYYDYDEGYTPEWPNTEVFQGRLIHPQGWPEDIALEGQRVVVIGSGATAVTLVPELAGRAKHVTMLQRSPTYIVSVPSPWRRGSTICSPHGWRTAWCVGRTCSTACMCSIWRGGSRKGRSAPSPS